MPVSTSTRGSLGTAMDDLPADLREFLHNQPFLHLTDAKKIQCTLNGHELPCNLAEVQSFISGKRYKKLCAVKEFNYTQYQPHLVPSTKQPNQLFCKLTLRHINRVPHHVLRHVGGKRFQKARAEYEECIKQGVEFVPARLRKKKRHRDSDDGLESTNEGSSKRKQKQDSGIWAPSSGEGEGSDSEDSMSDLYPATLFTLKKSDEQEEMEEDKDEFHTDDDDDDDDDMEVSEPEEKKQAMQKRKKVQSAAFTKKLKKNKKKKGFKQIARVKNGK